MHFLPAAMQSTHMVPLLPQSCFPSDVTQFVPEQHPVAQEVALQTQAPATHCCPLAQAACVPHAQVPVLEQLSAVIPQLVQAAPGMPQSDVVVGVAHVVPLQQPVGQVVALHTHAPATHACPATHSAPEPHTQAPLDEHALASVELHAMHAVAPVPHSARVGGETHMELWQQPDGHDAALQTHALATHA